jgi:hypothetical protein
LSICFADSLIICDEIVFEVPEIAAWYTSIGFSTLDLNAV